MRTISNIETLLILLDNTIRSILLPALLNGYSCSDMERNLISLPAKFGGLGIFKHQERSSVEYANSSKIITFWDTLYLRYNIQLRNLPSHCVCGKNFSIEHPLSCPKGGFISLKHNELREEFGLRDRWLYLT